MDIKKAIEAIIINLDGISDPVTKEIIIKLQNIIEFLSSSNNGLLEENQNLRDENNRLKGEKGKPKIAKQPRHHDISSEKERAKKNKKRKQRKLRKKAKIVVTRTEICELKKEELPSDVIFKGYSSIIIQDILIKPDNIEFKKAMYYSPSLKKTFIAPTPFGYEGEFGPNIKALVLDMHHSSKTTESAIHQFLQNHGVMISLATIARIIANSPDDFHQEKKSIVKAGLSSAEYQQMDDTGARVKGKNHHTHILCNPFYTAYFTRPKKNRLTILEILTQGELLFEFNESAYELMEQMQLSEKRLCAIKSFPLEKSVMNQLEIEAVLLQLFPNPKKHQTSRRIILEATAITAYQKLPHAIRLLLTDDAPQFKQITELLALCWIHDGRHYKKLDPVIAGHRTQLTDFLNRYWDYYHRLLDYKKSPLPSMAKSLSTEFDELFATRTGYLQLDDRIEKTQLKKDSLLLVLQYPSLPLHNNASELGARNQARYRDISFHTMSKKGTDAKDTFMTIIETAKKLSVNTYSYFIDRISKQCSMPSLAQLICEKNQSQFSYA